MYQRFLRFELLSMRKLGNLYIIQTQNLQQNLLDLDRGSSHLVQIWLIQSWIRPVQPGIEYGSVKTRLVHTASGVDEKLGWFWFLLDLRWIRLEAAQGWAKLETAWTLIEANSRGTGFIPWSGSLLFWRRQQGSLGEITIWQRTELDVDGGWRLLWDLFFFFLSFFKLMFKKRKRRPWWWTQIRRRRWRLKSIDFLNLTPIIMQNKINLWFIVGISRILNKLGFDK